MEKASHCNCQELLKHPPKWQKDEIVSLALNERMIIQKLLYVHIWSCWSNCEQTNKSAHFSIRKFEQESLELNRLIFPSDSTAS